jgi:putative flavoprotein involved in K+ transport
MSPKGEETVPRFRGGGGTRSIGTAPAIEAAAWLETFADALARNDAEAAANCFHEDSYWRDLVAFTWNIKTLEGAIRSAICSKPATAPPLPPAGNSKATAPPGTASPTPV